MKKLKWVILIIVVILVMIFAYNFIVKTVFPIKYSEYVEKYSKEYNIDKYLIFAIIKAESNFKENAKSTSNAVGLMQIMETTAIEKAKELKLEITEEDLYEPEINIRIGIKYFTDLLGFTFSIISTNGIF